MMDLLVLVVLEILRAAFQAALQVSDPATAVKLIEDYGGWGLSVVFMGVIALQYKQMLATNKAIQEEYKKIISDLTQELRRMNDNRVKP